LALKGLENFLCDSIRQISFGEHLPAGHANSKLGTGIFPPWSLTWQYNWLTKTTWNKAHAIPRVWPLKKLRTSSSFAKESTSQKGRIVCLPAMFTLKLQQGPFCRKKVFC